MERNKTILISYENQSKEISINTSKCTFAILYSMIKDEFLLTSSINIYTSDTNTKLNEINYNDFIVNSYEQSIEIYLQITPETETISFPKRSKTIIRKPQLNITNDNFTTDKCSLCLNEITQFKYVCTICDDYTLCQQCELNHDHPVFKFKTPFVANNKTELYKVMKIINNHKNNQYIKLSNNLYNNVVTIGTNLKKKINVKIKNKSQHSLTKNTFWLIATDYNDLELQYDRVIKEDIQPYQKINVPINIISGSNEKKYKIQFQVLPLVVHNLDKLFSNSMSINVQVIDDKEEEMFSFYFAENPEIQLLPKELMKYLYAIDIKKITSKTPKEVYELMKKSKWNIKQVIEKLKAG